MLPSMVDSVGEIARLASLGKRTPYLGKGRVVPLPFSVGSGSKPEDCELLPIDPLTSHAYDVELPV